MCAIAPVGTITALTCLATLFSKTVTSDSSRKPFCFSAIASDGRIAEDVREETWNKPVKR